MPALLHIEQCQYTNLNGTFQSENDTYGGPPFGPGVFYGWIHVTLLGVDGEGMASYSWASYQPPELGSFTFEFTPGGEYMTATVTDCAIHVEACLLTSGTLGPFDPPEGWEFWEQAYISDDNDGQIVFNQVTQTITYLFHTPGTYFITLLDQGNTPLWLIYVFEVTNCFIEEDLGECQSFPLMVSWLNPTGAPSTYIFYGKKTEGVDIGGSSTWKDSDITTRYHRHDNVYDTVAQPSGFITEEEIDLLKSMKYSAQAWVITGYGTVDEEWLPISNYAKSFVYKKQGNGFYEYNLEFNYAEEIITQTP